MARKSKELTDEEVLFGFGVVNRFSMRLVGCEGSEGRALLKTVFSRDVLRALVAAEAATIALGLCSGKLSDAQDHIRKIIRCGEDVLGVGDA